MRRRGGEEIVCDVRVWYHGMESGCMVLEMYVHTSKVRGMDVWMYGWMYVCMYVRMDVSTDGCLLACCLLRLRVG